MTRNRIDEKIKQALSVEDAQLFEQFGEEPSLLELALQTLTGRNRWLSALAMIVGIVFMVLAVLSLWQFILAEQMKAVVGWALAVGFCLSAVAMIKVWAWMEIEKNSTIREIKRLELQVARLTQRLNPANSESPQQG